MHDHIIIQLNKDQRHHWSPQLSILIQREPNDIETKITGIYGTMPNVWTLFAMSYLAISALFIFIAIIGSSQYVLSQEAEILWSLPILMLQGISLYFTSQLGQKLDATQTYAIHYFFQEALGERIPEG